jgi:predicted transcriptional regulator YdeE
VLERLNDAMAYIEEHLDGTVEAAQLARIAVTSEYHSRRMSDQEPVGLLSASVNLDASRAEGTELDYYHGVVTRADTPEGMDVLTVPAGTWAVFASSGPLPEAVQYLWRDVFTQWFPSHPYRSRPGPEIMRAEISQDGGHADAELWIPVERAAARSGQPGDRPGATCRPA